MSLSNLNFVRSTAILLLVGLAALAVIVGVTFWLSVRTEDISTQVTQTRQVSTGLIELRSLLQDAETGQRGFLLTRDEAYLAPYDAARAGLAAGIEQVAGMASPQDAAAIARLRGIIRDKMAELAETIEMARAGRIPDALAIVRTDRGKNLMDQARTEFRALMQAGDARLNDSTARQADSITALQRAVFAAVVLIALVVGSSAVMALRYTRELIAARAELATLNTGLEERVAERTAELGRANAELQRFAYIVGHDLRSPLVNVMGFTSELTEFRKEIFANMEALRGQVGAPATEADLQLQRDFDEAISFIRTSTTKMDGLINAILKLSREGKRPLTPERIDMEKLIGDAAVNIKHRVLEREGEVEVRGPFPTIVSDRFSLEQIFGNLLDNAVKYANPAIPPKITVTVANRGANVVFDVTDNGRGIAEGEKERVFELFRRAGKQDQPGEGIGLAYVRAHVRRLGGDVTITSVVGKGSTFHVRLPRTLQIETLAAA